MNNEDELLKIAEKISNECSQISNSFYKIADKIQTMNLLTPENQKNQIIKRNEEKTIKDESPKIRKKRKKIIRVTTFGRVFPIYCLNHETGKRIKGYKLHLTYKSKNFVIGPYRNYDFVVNIKEDLIKCLTNIPSEDASIEKIEKCLNELKIALYSKYPTLDSTI